MAKASDNEFPSVLFGEGSAPASPGAGTQRIFVDSADHKLKRVNSSGTVTVIEAGSNEFADLLIDEGSTPASPAAGKQLLFIDSADHKVKRVNSSGTVTTVEGGGGGLTALPIVFERITSGNLTLAGTTSWTTCGITDLVIPAVTGDIVEVCVTRRHIAGSDGVWLDVASIVSSAPVSSWAQDNAWSNTNTGLTFAGPSADTFEGVAFARAVTSGDLSGGNLTLRLYYRNNGSPTPSSTLCASIASGSLYFAAKNFKH